MSRTIPPVPFPPKQASSTRSLKADANGVGTRLTRPTHGTGAPYDSYTRATHSLCTAHVLRELAAVFEDLPEQQRNWARQAHAALLDLKRLVEATRTGGASTINADHAQALTATLRSAAVIGAEIAGGGRHGTKHRAPARRPRDRQADYLRFVHDISVPFDNNATEREIGTIKIRQESPEAREPSPGPRVHRDPHLPGLHVNRGVQRRFLIN